MSKETNKKWREERELKGLCECGNKKINNGFYCEICAEKSRLRYKLKKDNKLCVNCNIASPLEGKAKCRTCLEKFKKYRESRTEKGICPHCSRISDRPGFQCSKCVHAKRVKRKNAVELGLCSSCHSKPQKVGSTYCEECLKKHRIKRKNFDLKGLCVKCGKDRCLRSKTCVECYLKETAFRHLGSSIFSSEIKLKFEQQKNICPYTGIELILGENTDLDHIIPQHSGGTNELSNLQWVFSIVNKMKWNSSEQEFLSLVEKIYHYRIKK